MPVNRLRGRTAQVMQDHEQKADTVPIHLKVGMEVVLHSGRLSGLRGKVEQVLPPARLRIALGSGVLLEVPVMAAAPIRPPDDGF